MPSDPVATAAACPAFIDGACRQSGWRCSTCPRPTASPTSSASSEPTTAASEPVMGEAETLTWRYDRTRGLHQPQPATAAHRWAEDNDHRCEAVQPTTLQRCEYVPGHDLPHMAFTPHSTTAWGIEGGEVHE